LPLARYLPTFHEQRRALEFQMAALLEEHSLFSQGPTSIPGVSVRIAAVLLVTVGDGISFPSAAHLASYAGLAPATKSSGASSNRRYSSPPSLPCTTPSLAPTTAGPAKRPTPCPAPPRPTDAPISHQTYAKP
jgi:hypothetical protein